MNEKRIRKVLMGLGAAADLLNDVVKPNKKAFYYAEYCELAEMVNRLHGMRRDIHARFPGVSDAPEDDTTNSKGDETEAQPKARKLILKRYAPVGQPLPDLPPGVGLPDGQANAGSVIHPKDEQPPEQH